MFKNQKKPKYGCPEPEYIKEGQDYSFTMNPLIQYFDDPIRRLKVFIETKKFLSKFTCIQGVLYNEVSRNGRLHFHGTINIKSSYEFFVYCVPQLQAYCTYEIDELNHPEIWYKYCIKQSCIWGTVPRLLFEYTPTIVHPPVPAWFTQGETEGNKVSEVDGGP